MRQIKHIFQILVCGLVFMGIDHVFADFHTGDVSNDCRIDLEDTILALQIQSGLPPTQAISASADINGDHHIGMAEALYGLWVTGEMIPSTTFGCEGFPADSCNPDWAYLTSRVNSVSKVVIFPPPENTTTFIKCNSPTDGDAVVRVGSYRTTVWRGDMFVGNYCQEIGPEAKSLITMIQGTGGFDTGPGVSVAARVDDIHPDVTMSTTLEHNLPMTMVGNTGLWKAGPKISTRPCERPADCPDTWESGWHENYIVETSSKTPAQWHQLFSYSDSPSQPQYLGETYQDGATYKHYYRLHPTHQKWGQFWAIRQTFRSSGEVHIKPIYEKWRQHGLPNDYVGWSKYNIELHRPLEGGWCGVIKMLDFAAPENWKNPAEGH